MRCIAKLVTGVIVAGGLVLVPPAVAQRAEEGDALNAEINQLYREGKYAEAVPLAQRALSIDEQALGPDHPDVGLALNNLASLYRAQGRYVDAEPLLKRAITVREKALGADHPDVGQSLNNLAGLYHTQGRYAEAEPLFKRALSIREAALGADHPDVGQSLNNLAVLYEEQSRYAEAEPLYKRALSLRETALGADHPDVGQSLNNLAVLYKGQGRYAEAERLYKRALTINEHALGPDHPDVGLALNNLALLHVAEGRYVDAEPLFKRALSIREAALGADHPDVGQALNNLASLYQAQGSYAEAEPLFKRALGINEKALGPNHTNVATNLNNLGDLYRVQGRYGEAEPLFKRALSIREAALGADHPDVAAPLNNLAMLYVAQVRYVDAELLFGRSLAICEKTLGPEHALVATALNNLGDLYRLLGRYGEADPLYKRSLAIREKTLAADHPLVAASLNNLATLHQVQGRYAEAEPLYKRSLAIFEKALGRDHPDVVTPLNNLADLYSAQGRRGEAEPLYKRSLSLREKTLGPDHPDVGLALNNLALLYHAQGRYAEAEPLYKRSLIIGEKALDRDHPNLAMSANNLALLYQALDRPGEAEPLYRRSLAIFEKAFGPDHPELAATLNNLAGLYHAQGRYAEAEPLFKRALGIGEKSLGPEHPDVVTALSNLALLYFLRSDWVQAADFWRRSTDVIIRRVQRGSNTIGRDLTGKRKSEAELNSEQFWASIKVAYRLAAAGEAADPRLIEEMFQAAQWARSSTAAASLAEMAARGVQGNNLARIVRERQDLVGEWQGKDQLLVTARSNLPGQRNVAGEVELSERLATIDARMGEIDKTLTKEFANYAALASPEPLSIADVQTQLNDSEALILFIDTPELEPTPEETFIWVVTRTDSRWVKSELGSNSLRERVTALRCGLDFASWLGDGGASCTSKLDLDSATTWQPGDPLPFDLRKSYELYAALFGGIEDLIQGKSLLLVPSGPLTSLPFQVLITEAPQNRPYSSAPWLIRKHALTVLPSVASLAALRRNAKPSVASDPFVGFGNPVLSGHPRCGEVIVPDTCPQDDLQVAGGPANQTRSPEAVGPVSAFFRNGKADVSAIRNLCPLPDTAHELSCVAKSLAAPASSIVLGKDMTETAVKRGDLTRYRIVHFATHGLLAGETAQFVTSGAEPALVMTPPQTVTEEDDGLLTASEVAALKLDADWVVMSACNTAGGGEPGAEALSGLARAFFYAGTRALLVSHWPVNSYAATMLTSRTFAEIRRKEGIGRSEAFRRAMLALMSEAPWAAHPSVWAPFIVVGEGGAPSGIEAAGTISPPSPDTSAADTAATATTPASARRKMKRRTKPNDDWITGIFGQ